MIQLLTLDQIDDSLAAGGERRAALRAALREDAALRELAHSPLMLNLIVLSYPEAAPVAQAAGVSPDALRRRIFGSYIEHGFRHRSADPRYTRQQTMH